MLFKNIPGQTKLKHNLLTNMVEGRLPHAILLEGKMGYGVLGFAMAIAQYLECDNPTDEDSCGVCPHCLKSDKLIHPDIHFSFPTVGSKMVSDHFIKEWRESVADSPFLPLSDWMKALKAENKLPNITKDECKKIIQKLNLKAFSGKRKIQIIYLAEFLGKEGNRLLKLIEEPPDETHFILLTENSNKILNTIHSRCQLYKVPPLSNEDIKSFLVSQNVGGDHESLAFLSEGDINIALAYSQQNESQFMPIFLALFRASYAKKIDGMIDWGGAMAKLGRDVQMQFCQYVLQLLEQILRYNMTQNEAFIRMPKDDVAQIVKIARVMDFKQIEEISDLFDKTSYYISRNAHPKMLFLDLALKLNKIFKKIPLVHEYELG